MGASISTTSGRGRKRGTLICIISGRGRKTVGASAPTAPISSAPLIHTYRSSEERCVYMSARNGQWFDSSCLKQYHAVCQYRFIENGPYDGLV